MGDVTATTIEASALASTPKKIAAKKTGGAKKLPVKPNHPPTSEMVDSAIAALKDKKGSSLQAIKKYIAGTYKVDVEKQSTFIKKYLKAAVVKKTIVQTKGSGASGRFRLGAKTEGEKKKIAKKPAAKKSAGEKKAAVAKKPVAKKAVGTKKPAAAKKPAAKPTKARSPPKAKTSRKSPAAKPKTPKPKKAAAPKTKPTKK